MTIGFIFSILSELQVKPMETLYFFFFLLGIGFEDIVESGLIIQKSPVSSILKIS
jgi:hypothetical protein